MNDTNANQSSAGRIVSDGLWWNRPGLASLVGILPLLAVSRSFATGLALGIASLAVLCASNVLVSGLAGVDSLAPQVARVPRSDRRTRDRRRPALPGALVRAPRTGGPVRPPDRHQRPDRRPGRVLRRAPGLVAGPARRPRPWGRLHPATGRPRRTPASSWRPVLLVARRCRPARCSCWPRWWPCARHGFAATAP